MMYTQGIGAKKDGCSCLTSTINMQSTSMSHVSSRRTLLLPQFDFDGLPSIPQSKPYRQRMRYIKLVSKHNKTSVNSSSSQAITIRNKDKNVHKFNAAQRVLDRKKMLEYGHAEEAESVLEVIADERELEDVDITCLKEFTALYFLDLSANSIAMEKLATLPALKELVLTCNHLSFIQIPDGGFTALEVLDLSFNCFDDPFLFDQIAKLRLLRKLNLSANNLQHLPSTLVKLTNVEELILEGNVLQEDVFHSINTLPSLKRVNLNSNYIERVPVLELYGLLNLEELYLGNNKITYYDDIYTLKNYKSLKKLILWGNPIISRKKEIENMSQHLSKPLLFILIDGPVPLESKYLGVGRFYSKKIRRVDHFDPMKQIRNPGIQTRTNYNNDGSVILPLSIKVGDNENDKIEQDGSFFITESNNLENENPLFSPIRTERVNSFISVKELNEKEFKASNDSEMVPMHVSNLSSMLDESNNHKNNFENEEDQTSCDYNSDWIKLDETLKAIDENLKMDSIVPELVNKSYVFSNKKKMYSLLRQTLKSSLNIKKKNEESGA
jgi:Leucine-rich repeat (LRR) protein